MKLRYRIYKTPEVLSAQFLNQWLDVRTRYPGHSPQIQYSGSGSTYLITVIFFPSNPYSEKRRGDGARPCLRERTGKTEDTLLRVLPGPVYYR